MGWTGKAALTAAMAATAGGLLTASAGAQPRQQVTGPIADYWMSAQTSSGFGAGMMSGQRPSMGSMMGMMMGGGQGRATQTLTLQLGSSQKAQGQPQADHVPPPNLRAGQALPLLTPRAQPTQRTEEAPEMPREMQRPRGRMLIFWGCGETARPGQPVVIDFAQVAEGKLPPGLEALGRGLNVTPMRPPSPGRNATYGEWPNERTRTQIQAGASLQGEHVVRGNYSPEIRFSLGPDQDFMAPLQITANRGAPGGGNELAWRGINGAQAYLASAIGGGRDETVVLWTSSEIQASAFALPDYLTPGDLTRLVGQRALMAPATTRCVIPRQVVEAAPQALIQLAAYGKEANFSYPPRPSDPRQPWNIQWTAKVRYRSTTGALMGMDMGGMGGGMGGQMGGRGEEGRGQPQGRPGMGDVLRGMRGF